ncbi:MAG: choice-of-anchor Q domain-containing protein [Synechococcus sp.]
MATFTVTNTWNGGAGSLRKAIVDSNSTAGADEIEFDSSLSGKKINLKSQLVISDDLTINGDIDNDGTPDITVDGNQKSGVFNIDNGSTSASSVVLLNGLTISGGYESGVQNREDLTITNSEISGNSNYGYGGGINNGGTLSLIGSTVKDNSVVYDSGGGIANFGDLFISNSTVSGNSAGYLGPTSNGDEISSSGNIEIVNSTISGNSGEVVAGIEVSNGSASISNSTVLTSTQLYNRSQLSLNNSITGPIFTDRAIQTSGINIVENGVVTGSLTLDPKLGPLQNNGGPTKTHALLPGSPAIGLGNNSTLPADVKDLDGDGNTSEPIPFDQRGEGFNRIANGTVDIGAFEDNGSSSLTPPSLSPSLTVDTLVDENDFDLSPGDVSLREAIAFVKDGGTINFDSSLSGGTILLNSSLIVPKSLSIEGLGADQLTVDQTVYDRVFLVDDGNDSVNQTVDISGLTITGGSGRYFGGSGSGINNQETLTITSSHITGNGGTHISGGGIFNDETGILTVSDSTISNNYAGFGGGAIENLGTLTVSNSTISGSDQPQYDEGDLLNQEGATATIINSTFNNTHPNSGDIDIVNRDGTVELISSIATSIESYLYYGGSISAQDSLIVSGTIDNDLGGNIIGVSPNFDPAGLKDNGGPTPTIALQQNSPAIDAGSNPQNLSFDQRGKGFLRTVGQRTDIGAFEVQSGGPTPSANPLLFSLKKNQTINGLAAKTEDIVQFDGEKFSTFFDGSDVGLGGKKPAISAFDVIGDNKVLLSFERNFWLKGFGNVNRSDVLLFKATSLGHRTRGRFSKYFDGSDVGLNGYAENIDGLTGLANGNLLISTRGNLRAKGGYSAKNEDVSLFEFSSNSTGNNTKGTFSQYFDGGDVGLGSRRVNAFSLDESDLLLFSTDSTFRKGSLKAENEDVFAFEPRRLGTTTRGSFVEELFFDGSQYGLQSNDIFAVDSTFNTI